MTTTTPTKMMLPAELEIQAAVQGQRALATYLATRFEMQHIKIFDGRNQAHQVELPTYALRLLVDILAELADGNAVNVMSVHAELTTQEAANILNVSRPHMVKLLEDGALPFHRAGKHRRVRFADLMQYKDARNCTSAEAMAELTRQAQEAGMGTNEAFPLHCHLRCLYSLSRNAARLSDVAWPVWTVPSPLESRYSRGVETQSTS